MTLHTKSECFLNARLTSMLTYHLPQFIKEFDGVGKMNFPGCDFAFPGLFKITGDNGSGKSTLLDEILEKGIKSGTENRNVRAVLLNQSFEDYLYLYKPIWWNITLPLVVRGQRNIDILKGKAQSSLNMFNVSIENIDRFPFTLSGGEKHILMLARLSLVDTDILLLDEPTTDLDATNRKHFWALIKWLCKDQKRSVFVVTHDELSMQNGSCLCHFSAFNKKEIKIDELL
jgi:ABC-type lipoprotein export system ATPase subunit